MAVQNYIASTMEKVLLTLQNYMYYTCCRPNTHPTPFFFVGWETPFQDLEYTGQTNL